MTRVGVVVFPGSNCDGDTLRAIELAGGEAVRLWHEETALGGCAAIVVPGGFAYGDYLRAGVIARFSPVMRSVAAFASAGGLVLGICNGFQVIAEAGLVPGALLRNRGLRFLGRDVLIAAERLDTPFTHLVGPRRPLRLPIAHGEGCYFAEASTLADLERDGQVLFRYVHADGTAAGEAGDSDNPNGSLHAIAGVLNRRGNVAGLMPHPERASEAILGSDDGFGLLRSLVESARAAEQSAPGAASLDATTGSGTPLVNVA
ncbi:MAG TPA: phosphoribosylformylglycinamidine synthase subunit PurQ [Candidatus Binatus sp.]|nr:phosphoribosylformylglycinamidine synthase subunit PurQ [Candidatus Binatus sp.]